MEGILSEHGIPVHSVTWRCKARESLERKVEKPDKNYSSLGDLTDIAAIRVITYFEPDVDRVADIVRSEFQIDDTNSFDKRVALEPDRFGYQSVHFVATLSVVRSQLVEYRRFGDLRFKIQVRSILQHAWAEIEHDLGYKAATGIPREFRRRFARIAGLLEIADIEFAALRAQLAHYESKVPGRIATEPDKVDVDFPSLRAAFAASETLKKLDEGVAAAASATIDRSNEVVLKHLPDRLEFVGIRTVAELEVAAQGHENGIQEFARGWLEGDTHTTMAMGIGGMYLAYMLVGEKQDLELASRYLATFRFSTKDERIARAKKLLLLCAGK